MIRRWFNIYLQVFIMLIVVAVVWYGQATFDIAADYVLRGDFFALQGQLEIAQDYYEQAVVYDIDNMAYQYQLGLIYLEHKQYSKAFASFSVVEEAGYGNPFSVQYQLGRAAYYRWDYPLAIAHFEEARINLNIDASYDRNMHSTLLTLLGWSYFHTVGCDIARGYFDAALQLVPDISLADVGLRRCA